jgi:hypothetical protein
MTGRHIGCAVSRMGRFVFDGTEVSREQDLVKRKRLRRASILATVATLWVVTIGVGLAMLWNYQNSSGAAGVPPSRWPANSSVKLAAGRPTLVMLAHPHCPCTRSSIGELALLMARSHGRVSAYVLFFKPPNFPDGWERTDLWESAGSIPGVTVLSDEGGVEAGRFNAMTSGATMLYGADGRLLFSGGITGSRGHSGDNDGRSAIVALVTGEAATQAETAVFGCSLVDENAECGKGEERCSQ